MLERVFASVGAGMTIPTATVSDVLNGHDPADKVGNAARLVDAGWSQPDANHEAAQFKAEALAAAEALRRERNTRNARLVVDREEAEAAMRLPPKRESYMFASYRAEQRPPKVERVQSMQRERHRTALIASYKTGKTTLHANLTWSLVTGKPLLGRFKVKPPEGNIGVWNAEMDSEDYEQYLVDAGVSDDAGVAIWNMRGYRLALTTDAGSDAAVAWLKDNAVSYWIIDPWARVCGWSNVDEDKNPEVGPLLQRIDEIADEANVSEVLIVHHAGHVGGHARGASVFSDWPDGLWLYSRDEEDDTLPQGRGSKRRRRGRAGRTGRRAADLPQGRAASVQARQARPRGGSGRGSVPGGHRDL